QRTHHYGDHEAERERARGDSPLPAKLGQDRRIEQRKCSACVNPDPHRDEGDGDDDPAVEKWKLDWRSSRHGRRVQCSVLTAPTGASPLMMKPTCRTVSSAWCSIACGVSPPTWGVAITFGSLASSGIGIWSGARPTSIAAPAMRFSRKAAARAASSTRLPRERLM